MILVGRFFGLFWWLVGGLVALGLWGAAKDGAIDLPGLAEPPWEYIDATTYKEVCEKQGGATYQALGEKDGQALYFERPCSQPPPENLR